jgi:phage shock protein A
VGAAHRIAELREVDVDALLERAEEARGLLDYTSSQQQDLLDRIWTAITDVTAGRKRARMRESRLRRSADRLQRQAAQAVAGGRDDYARQAMAWRSTILHHVAELTAEQAALRTSEERLSAIASRLQAQIEAFRIHRETASAEYTTTQPVTGPGQVPDGIPARLDGLVVSGALGKAGSGRIDARLDAISRQTAVEAAMAQIMERTRAQ